MPSGILTSTVHANRARLLNMLLLLLLAVGSTLLPVTAKQPQPPPHAPAAGNSATAWAPRQDEQSMDLLVILKDGTAADMLQAVCSHDKEVFMQYASQHNISTHCHLAGLCRHVYQGPKLQGLAASLTERQVADLHRCLPEGCIDYIEEDVKVYKAEGPKPKARAGPGGHLGKQSRGRSLLKSGSPSPSQDNSSTPLFKRHAEAEDGSASGPTTDPVLIQLQQSFIPNASNMQASGISPSFYITPQNVLTTITAGYLPQSPTNQASVQTAEGPPPTSHSGSDQTLFMGVGLKAQQLHSAQWNLDRIDQPALPLNQTFKFGSNSTVGTGQGVTVYTLDSGVRQTHQEFQPWQGKQQRVSLGPSFSSDSPNATDCDGHGTHIGSTAVGRVVGVAKEASLVAVRVLDCTGSGQVSDVVKGLEWVGINHKLPAVVTMSLGVQAGQWSQTLQTAVTNLIDTHGITVVVAAGNDQIDACQITPANVNGTIAAAGSDLSNKFNPPQSGDYELIYEYDNTGPCVDVFAPGVDIMAACGGAGRCTPLTDSNYAWASGTSMAVPHVAGAAAIYLSQNPNATPAEVSQIITSTSSTDLLSTTGMLPGTPNRLLYVRPDVI